MVKIIIVNQWIARVPVKNNPDQCVLNWVFSYLCASILENNLKWHGKRDGAAVFNPVL
jgi:hypothetical protein